MDRLGPEVLIEADFLYSLEVEESFDEKDQKILQRLKDQAATRQSREKPIKERVVQLYHKLNPEVSKPKKHKGDGSAGKGKGKGKGAAAGSGGASSSGGAPPVDERRFTQEEAQLLCPPGARIYRDAAEGRWQVFFKPFGSKSRAWKIHGGEQNALAKVLKWAYEQIRTTAPHAWIQEIDWR